MPVPAGTQGVTVNIGPLYDLESQPIVGKRIVVTLSAKVDVTGAGITLPSSWVGETGTNGAVAVELVASDSTGISIEGFTYNFKVPGLTPLGGVNVLLPAAVPSVQFEDLVPIEQDPGVVLWVPGNVTDTQVHAAINAPGSATRNLLDTLYAGGVGAIASVDGRTGVVTLGDLYDAAGSAATVGAAAATALANHHAPTSTDHDDRYTPSASLGNAATRNVGTAAGTVAAGDDIRFLLVLGRYPLKWSKASSTWGTIPSLAGTGAIGYWATSTDDPDAPPPGAAVLAYEDSWWDRADGAPWPIA